MRRGCAQVIWLPFLFIPISAVSYVGVPPSRSNEASALINLMRNLGGSVGVSFVTTMLEERRSSTMRGWRSTSPRTTAMAGPRRLPPVDAMVQAQAAVMSYLDIFWVLGWWRCSSGRWCCSCRRCPKGAAPRAIDLRASELRARPMG